MSIAVTHAATAITATATAATTATATAAPTADSEQRWRLWASRQRPAVRQAVFKPVLVNERATVY